jgi:hypothetical protein
MAIIAKIMDSYIVFEYTEKASPQYRGTRFMTSDDGQPIVDWNGTKMVARGLCEKDAHALINVSGDKNIKAFLSDLPDELRDPKSDAFIAYLVRNGSKGDL